MGTQVNDRAERAAAGSAQLVHRVDAPAAPGPARSSALAPLFLVAATAFLAHFARLPQFGLYEDDYWAIAPHLYRPVGELWGMLVHAFTVWPQGRPLNHFLPFALARIGSSIGGLEGAYLLGAGVLALNGSLVFLVVRRVTSAAAALVAALAYVLFPADSTKILLVHAAHIQGAMTFLLLGIWLWQKGGVARPASYPVAALALLSYETAFLPFLAVPLLWASDRRRTLRTWSLHVLACVGIVALFAAVRFATGDGRAAEAADRVGQSLYRMTTSLALGPMTSGRSILAGARFGWTHLDALAAFVAALVVAGFAATLRATAAPAALAGGRSARWPSWLNVGDGEELPWWWLLACALGIWSLSYALTLINYPPTQRIGRLTSSHVAAGFPVAVAAGALFQGARRARWRWAPRLAAAIFAAWLAGVVGYHHWIQREYVRAWGQQRDFWRQALSLAPEVGPGWSLVVGGVPREGSPVIYANSWADYHVLRDVFAGAGEPAPAFAHLGHVGPFVDFRREGDRVEWRPEFWGGAFQPLDPARLVLLFDEGGVLRRVRTLSTRGGELVSTAAPPAGARDDWPATPVSRLLFPERFP